MSSSYGSSPFFGRSRSLSQSRFLPIGDSLLFLAVPIRDSLLVVRNGVRVQPTRQTIRVGFVDPTMDNIRIPDPIGPLKVPDRTQNDLLLAIREPVEI